MIAYPPSPAPSEDAPVRLVCRHVSRMLLARGARWKPLMPLERLAQLVMETVFSAGIAHLPYRMPGVPPHWLGLGAASEAGRPVSVLALTRSLDLPYASTARRVTELVGAGFLRRESRGIRVAPQLLADNRLPAVVAADKADLAETLTLLAQAGHDPAPALRDGGLDRLPADVIERALLAFSLRVLESVKELYGDVVNGVLAATIVAANVNHLIVDAELGGDFTRQDEPPPDALRQPIPVRVLARDVAMPFETVRRRVNELRARDIVEAREDGVVLPTRVLMRDAHLADNLRITRHFHGLLDTLADLAVR